MLSKGERGRERGERNRERERELEREREEREKEREREGERENWRYLFSLFEANKFRFQLVFFFLALVSFITRAVKNATEERTLRYLQTTLTSLSERNITLMSLKQK